MSPRKAWSTLLLWLRSRSPVVKRKTYLAAVKAQVDAQADLEKHREALHVARQNANDIWRAAGARHLGKRKRGEFVWTVGLDTAMLQTTQGRMAAVSQASVELASAIEAELGPAWPPFDIGPVKP